MDQPIETEVVAEETTYLERRNKWLQERHDWWVAFEETMVEATVFTYGIDKESVDSLGALRWSKRSPVSPNFYPSGLLITTVQRAVERYRLADDLYVFAKPEEDRFDGF